MPMSEELLKVRLSPAKGMMRGTFDEGMPVAEAIGMMFAFQIDGTEGERIRRYGRVSGVHDNLLNIENNKQSDEQVQDTTIFFVDAPPMTIIWRRTAVAVAEIALEMDGPNG